MADPALLVDSDWHLEFANEAALSYADADRETIEGEPILDLTNQLFADSDSSHKFERALETVYANDPDTKYPIAVEHSKPEAVTIEVRAEENEDGTARIAVEDDGPGIPTAQRDSLFDRGEKGESSPGSGFGLYFVQSMVDIYGGDIRVESAEPDARFVIDLPLDRADRETLST